MQFALLERREEPFGELFSLDGSDADCGILSDGPPKRGTSVPVTVLTESGPGVAPALSRKSNVAATLETPVKWIGS